jgi:gentisate 1,2-dioxygenase
MYFLKGKTIHFDEYLLRAQKLAIRAAHWSWKEIKENLNNFPNRERGTLALISPDDGSSSEIAPGISLTLQIINVGHATRSHTHSFWHIYFVVSGEGNAFLGQEVREVPIKANDVVYVPPWEAHYFTNNGQETLMLYALQNLPQIAALGTLVRNDGSDQLSLIYKDANLVGSQT